MMVRVGKRVVLHDVNLRIGRGSVAVLFGPNGCGKTSLLKAMMGCGESVFWTSRSRGFRRASTTR